MSEAVVDENGPPIELPRQSEPVVTYTIIAINVIVFVAMCIKGVPFLHPQVSDVIPWGAGYGPLTLGGQWWRPLTEIFVHFGLAHIGVNMYILFQVGVLTEILFGKIRYIILYLAAGLAGSLTSLYVHPLGVSAGASGAIFGVFGALLAFLLVERGVIPKRAAMQIARSAALFLAFQLIYGFYDKTTDLSAHVGGLVAGFVVGCVLLLHPRATGPGRMPTIQIVTVIAVTCAFASVGLRFVPKADRGVNDWNRQSITAARLPAPNQGVVMYSGSATKDDATKLMKGLAAENFFARPRGIVLLSKSAGETTLMVPVGPSENEYLKAHPPVAAPANGRPGEKPVVPAPIFPWNDARTIAAYTETGIHVAPLVGGPPMRILLLTDTGEVRRTIPIVARELIPGTRDRVWYSGAATLKDAEALAEALKVNGLFRGNGLIVALSKNAAGTQLSFVIGSEGPLDPRVAAVFQELTRRVAPSVGGLPITVNVVDPTLQVKASFLVK